MSNLFCLDELIIEYYNLIKSFLFYRLRYIVGTCATILLIY